MINVCIEVTVEVSEDLLCELRDFIYALSAPFPAVHITVGRMLPREAARQHIQACHQLS